MTKTVYMQLRCDNEEAGTKILYLVGHLVALNNVKVRTADTGVLIIALANKKIPADINVWLKMGLHMSNTLRYKSVHKLQQTSVLYFLEFHAFTGCD